MLLNLIDKTLATTRVMFFSGLRYLIIENDLLVHNLKYSNQHKQNQFY